MSNSLSFKIAAVFLSLIVTSLAFEAALWVFYPTPYHEWMEWQADGHIKGRGVPGTSFATAKGYRVRINSLGFRGPDPSWQPARRTLRVLVFGGSSTFNYHAQGEEETWPRQLQLFLSKSLRVHLEVINLALPGFSTKESKINYLLTARELYPHVVVLYHTWNDLKFFRRIERDPRSVIFARVATNKPLWQRIARMSQIGRLARNALLKLSTEKTENYYTSLEETGERANQQPASVAFDWARRNFDDFARFARADGVMPVLVSQATLAMPNNFSKKDYRIKVNNDYVGMTFPALAESWLEMRRIIERSAEDYDALYVDGYAAVPSDLGHLTDHVHLTRKGSRLLAEAIGRRLLENAEFQDLVARINAQL